MASKTKATPLNQIIELLPKLERPDLAIVEAKLSELLNNNGKPRNIKKLMAFSFIFEGKTHELTNSANGVARPGCPTDY